ncbi:MAG: MBL fold metallo-hydrolase [Gammaproteobacteria bacterium]|nr:MBL fold metallo-hydrolase [Gammaproteobacteria bacterium]
MLTLSLLLALPSACAAAPAPDWDKIEFAAQPLGGGVTLLASGRGGNVAVLVGSDGVLLVDDEVQPLSARLRAAVARVSDRPVRFVLNTHWHFDHVGGNPALGGDGAVIMAHERVRQRMAEGQAVSAFGVPVPPAAAAALPIVTFADGLTVHFDGETVELRHVAPAHTDGDAVVFFRRANVVHMGDLFWNGMYPLVDGTSGGSMAGMIAGLDMVLARIDETTTVIPGHGPVGDRAALQGYRDMLDTVAKRVAGLRKQGRSADEIVAARPTADLDAAWGKGLFTGEQWVRLVAAAP